MINYFLRKTQQKLVFLCWQYCINCAWGWDVVWTDCHPETDSRHPHIRDFRLKGNLWHKCRRVSFFEL